jgi:transposase InsO family protein
MCKVLKISRSSYYYKTKAKLEESGLVVNIVDLFKSSRNNYGTRKIKSKLADRNIIASRRRIGRIMKKEGLISSYTTAKFRPQKEPCNESKIENMVDRQFSKQPFRNVVVSDLTYVRVGISWHYICVLVDLFNREIIGYSAGRNKTADLVKQAFGSVKGNLQDIQIFHTDRGNEFKNQTIDQTLAAFNIKRSLSHKRCPYDNAVAEATFKSIKTEFVKNRTFTNLYHLQIELADYVNWFNNHRIHSSLAYLTPVKFRMNTL